MLKRACCPKLPHGMLLLRLGRKHGVRFDARFVNLMVAMVVVQEGARCGLPLQCFARNLRSRMLKSKMVQGVSLRLNGDGDIMSRPGLLLLISPSGYEL